MKRSRTEKSPWIKSKTKPGLNMTKIDEFHPDRRQNLAESDKGSWFNQLSESESAIVSSLDVSADSKKQKIVGATKAEESNVMRVTSKNEPGLFFIVGFFIVRNECLLETTLWHLLLGLFLFCGSTSFSFRFVLCWPRLKRVPLWTRAVALAP